MQGTMLTLVGTTQPQYCAKCSPANLLCPKHLSLVQHLSSAWHSKASAHRGVAGPGNAINELLSKRQQSSKQKYLKYLLQVLHWYCVLFLCYYFAAIWPSWPQAHLSLFQSSAFNGPVNPKGVTKQVQILSHTLLKWYFLVLLATALSSPCCPCNKWNKLEME